MSSNNNLSVNPPLFKKARAKTIDNSLVVQLVKLFDS